MPSTSACCCSPAPTPTIAEGERISFDARAGRIVARRRPGAGRRTHSRFPARHGRGRRPAGPASTTLPTKDTLMSAPLYDLLIKNVRVVRPHGNAVHEADIAIAGGKFAKVAPGIDVALAKAVHDGKGRLAFPGVVDAHMHTGIYSPLDEDAVSESKAAAMGGVTSSLNYFRTGQYYLNKGGPYEKFIPEVLETRQRALPRGLRLSPGADGQHAHRRDRDADREVRRDQLQDLHVLRLDGLHGASDTPARFPDDRRRGALRRRALRVRDARRPGRAREDFRSAPRRSRCRCIARPPRS